MKIMNRYIVILSFLLAASQIYCQKTIDLKSDKSLTKVFNQTEIKGLESMIQYVDNMVLIRKNKTDPNEAYHLFFEEIAQTSEYIVPFEETIKYKFLESLDSIQFSTIWRFEYHINMIRTGDTVYRNLENFQMLDIKPFGKYMNYLEETGKDDPYFQKLREEFDNVGNLSAMTSDWFPKNHLNFDFNIPKNRLWATIYLLRREETIEMKLDRYLKNNKNVLPTMH
ncbi:MAG: hypothetical protein COC08_08500 [Maribacter sp.]|nr:MAG: hypothetical protein COC08_08500 [Maribacter sp.]